MDIESGSLINAVIGIGINVSTTEFPVDLTHKAGSLVKNTALLSRNKLVTEVVREYLGLLKCLPDISFMEEYRRASTVLGKELTVTRWNDVYHGRAIAIDDRGQLVLETSSGTRLTLNSGEVSLSGQPS